MSLATLREPETTSSPRSIPGVSVGRGELVEAGTRALPLRFGLIDDALPDGGLPRGAVVEIAAPSGLARATSIALAACASAQAEAKLRGGKDTVGAWCAWIEGEATSLFAPAVAAAGVDLARLLVIRPPAEALSRAAVRAAASGVFSVIVVDLAGVPGQRGVERLDRWVNAVRRLALSIEGMETTIVLLTDALAKRSSPLPAALRLEVDRVAPDRLMVRVAKDRRGRVSSGKPVSLPAIEGAPQTSPRSAARPSALVESGIRERPNLPQKAAENEGSAA